MCACADRPKYSNGAHATAAGDVDVEERANDEGGGARPTLQLKESDKLPAHDGVTSGVLDNGLRYCIFPNKKPAGRFYVNLEVTAGSRTC